MKGTIDIKSLAAWLLGSGCISLLVETYAPHYTALTLTLVGLASYCLQSPLNLRKPGTVKILAEDASAILSDASKLTKLTPQEQSVMMMAAQIFDRIAADTAVATL